MKRIIAFCLCIYLLNSCTNNTEINKLNKLNLEYKDSIEYLNTTINCYEDSINKLRVLSYNSKELVDTLYDSLNSKNYIIDSLQTELFVAEFKLERIKEYNSIAAKGNNIKFLRGWINRVLSE